MKYVAAYLLASLGGNAEPSAHDLVNILQAGSLKVDLQHANALVGALSGKSLEEVVADGSKKLASVGSMPSAGGGPETPATVTAPEEKKEDKKKEEEPKEESDDDMGFGLFD